MHLKLVVFYGSARSSRQGIRAARFVLAQCRRRGHEAELIEPLSHPLPILDRMYKEYAKGTAPQLTDLAFTGARVLGLDWTIDLAVARRLVPQNIALQGNLDPVTLFGPISEIEFIGMKNYSDVVSIYPPFWPAIQNNLIWLVFLFVIPTVLGMFLAVVLDRERFPRGIDDSKKLPEPAREALYEKLIRQARCGVGIVSGWLRALGCGDGFIGQGGFAEGPARRRHGPVPGAHRG